jgi:hypothetical protein
MKLGKMLVGLEERFLHQVAGVGLALEGVIDPGPGQQAQVMAVGIQESI